MSERLPAVKIAGVLAIVSTLLLVAFHVVFATHAGALWRDEVNSLEVATMRTFSEMWTNMSFDSFPILFFLLLRTVAGVPANVSDVELRLFGCCIGLFVVGMIWLNARWLRLGFPVISLALIGFNPMMIRYTDSIRAYGLGMVTMLFSVGAMWRVTQSCTRGRVALALISALLSVHTLYHNAFLLFAVCMGAVAVTVRGRNYPRAAVVLAIGGITALSLLPYRPIIRSVRTTNFMWKVDFTINELWRNLALTLGSHSALALWSSVLLFLVVGGTGIFFLIRKQVGADQDRLLFSIVALFVGVIAYTVFLLNLSYRTRPWYYVVAIAFVAICLEMIFASLSQKRWILLARSAFALFFIGAVAAPTFGTLIFRQTNVDRVAAQVQANATAGDLVLLNTWNYGISFHRYYHGAVRLETVPPIDDLRSHRVDLVKVRMTSTDPIARVLREVEDTLRSGHTVWVIGRIDFVAPGKTPFSVSPGYDGPQGWVGGDFYQAWSEQISFVFQNHATDFARVIIPSNQPIMHFENLRLNAISGWRDEPLAALN